MSFDQLVFVAFLVTVGCYVGGMILGIMKCSRESKRLKVAKEKGWFVETKIVRRRNIDSHNLADTREMKSRSMVETVYEYEINGKKKKVKIRSDVTAPQLDKVYYDPEDKYRALNLLNSKRANAIVLIPLVIFVGIMLVGKFIFKI